MKKWLVISLRSVFILVGIIILTSFSIDATDTLKDSQTALSIFANRVTADKCPSDMVEVRNADNLFCIDRYENSVGENCPNSLPKSFEETAMSLNVVNCVPVSKDKNYPWVNVTKIQAEQLCAKAGKYLPNLTQWYLSSLGTPDNNVSCNTNTELIKAGSNLECRSGSGAFDMIGNVWELVSSEVNNGQVDDVKLPSTGYVDSVGPSGLPLSTSNIENPIYNADYFWVNQTGRYAVMRGGFYGSRLDGGIFSTQASIDINFSSGAIGFRCAKNL